MSQCHLHFEMFSGMGPILIIVDQQWNKILFKGTRKGRVSLKRGTCKDLGTGNRSFLMGKGGWWDLTGSYCSIWWPSSSQEFFFGGVPLEPQINCYDPPPPKKKKRKKGKEKERKRERERGQRTRWKKTDWICCFFSNELFNFVCFYAFLHFSGVELPLSTSSGKSELSECQECWFLAFCS